MQSPNHHRNPAFQQLESRLHTLDLSTPLNTAQTHLQVKIVRKRQVTHAQMIDQDILRLHLTCVRILLENLDRFEVHIFPTPDENRSEIYTVNNSHVHSTLN